MRGDVAEGKPLLIGLNLLHALPGIGGVWNYIQNLLASLAERDRINQYIAFATSASAVLVPQSPNFRTHLVRLKSVVRPYRILYEHSLLQVSARRLGIDCMHWFANGHGMINAAPALVTVYDLQPFFPYYPLPRLKRLFLRWRLRAAVSNAAVLLPMSHSTASDLESMLGARPERMTVVPPTLDPGFRPAAAEEIANCRAKYGLPDAFWLYVAHMYPHKNHERLLRAYRSVKSVMPSAWPLVLRGDPTPALPDPARLVAELGLSHEVLLLPRLGRTELPALYSAASALVFPSIYEGAGIPVLEAIACGCPLLASGIPAVREFAGDAARYFDPLDVDQMAGEMLAFAANAEQRRFLSRRGLDRAAGFRASDGIDGLTTAYRLAAGCGRNRATSSP